MVEEIVNLGDGTYENLDMQPGVTYKGTLEVTTIETAVKSFYETGEMPQLGDGKHTKIISPSWTNDCGFENVEIEALGYLGEGNFVRDSAIMGDGGGTGIESNISTNNFDGNLIYNHGEGIVIHADSYGDFVINGNCIIGNEYGVWTDRGVNFGEDNVIGWNTVNVKTNEISPENPLNMVMQYWRNEKGEFLDTESAILNTMEYNTFTIKSDPSIAYKPDVVPFHTEPLYQTPEPDSDGDGIPNSIEDLVENPYGGIGDWDKDGIPNRLDKDDDGDGASTLHETTFGYNPYNDQDTPHNIPVAGYTGILIATLAIASAAAWCFKYKLRNIFVDN